MSKKKRKCNKAAKPQDRPVTVTTAATEDAADGNPVIAGGLPKDGATIENNKATSIAYSQNPKRDESSSQVGTRLPGNGTGSATNTATAATGNGNEKGNGNENDSGKERTELACTLLANPHIRKLSRILADTGRNGERFNGLLSSIGRMGGMLRSTYMAADMMRAQIDGAKGIRSHPVKDAMEKAAKKLETCLDAITEKLGRVHGRAIHGSKNAVLSIKVTRVSPHDDMSCFYRGIKPCLKAIGKHCAAGIGHCREPFEEIGKYVEVFHAEWLRLKDMGRMVAGREPLDIPKELYRAAKSMRAPYEAAMKCLSDMRAIAKETYYGLDALDAHDAPDARQTKEAAAIGDKVTERTEKQVNGNGANRTEHGHAESKGDKTRGNAAHMEQRKIPRAPDSSGNGFSYGLGANFGAVMA